jgi:hypothetical protein
LQQLADRLNELGVGTRPVDPLVGLVAVSLPEAVRLRGDDRQASVRDDGQNRWHGPPTDALAALSSLVPGVDIDTFWWTLLLPQRREAS